MKIVFFCPNILRDAHRRIFQLDRLKKENFDFIFLDATEYYGNKSTATDKLIIQNLSKCNDIKDFKNFKKLLDDEQVLYICFDNYMQFASPVLNILVRKNDKVLSFHTKRFSSVHLPSSSFRKITDTIIKKLDKILPLHIFKGYYRSRYGFYVPDYFLCSTTKLIPTKIYFSVKRSNRIVVHSDDINHTLENIPSALDPTKKVGVFLDQVIPYQNILHPGIEQEIQPEGYIDYYYERLNTTLQRLKKKMDLDEVVIALHPDSVKYKDEIEQKIKNYRTFLGITHELIRDSKVIFAHSSTALGWAIFYSKPVVLLQEEYLMRQLMGKYMTFFEKELGFKTYSMEENFSEELPTFEINQKKYNEYTLSFLKDNNIQENSYYYAISKIKHDIDT